ncbi:MAG: endonuclease/exonuclease/phosphatase family protein [Desulfosudaceae bacterium]
MTPRHQNKPDGFSVMTINVRFGLADSGEFSWKNRKAAFTELFAAWQPDFIAMQEVNDFQAAFFRTVLSDYGCLGERRPAPSFWQNVLIFHKKIWQCRAHDHFFLSDTPAVPSRMPESKWPRQAVIGEFLNGDKRLVCLNTHFDFSEYVQQKSVDIILRRLAAFAAPGTPEIIAGDFNAGPQSACYQSLTDGSLTQPPFRDPFDPEAPGTFHNFTGCPISSRVDWILWRHNAHPRTRQIITDQFRDFYPSDHFPVYAAFEYITGPNQHPENASNAASADRRQP